MSLIALKGDWLALFNLYLYQVKLEIILFGGFKNPKKWSYIMTNQMEMKLVV